MSSLYYGKEKISNHLIDKFADVIDWDIVDCRGDSLLHHACIGEHATLSVVQKICNITGNGLINRKNQVCELNQLFLV